MANPTITLVGRLGQDPVSIGDTGLRLRLVTNDRVKNEETGKYEDSATSWWTVKVWGRLAEQTRNSIKKGQELTVVGKIYEENWTDKTGTNRSSYEVRADSIAVTTYSINKEKVADRMFEENEVPF
jgi:single-strand DNA-binding protein